MSKQIMADIEIQLTQSERLRDAKIEAMVTYLYERWLIEFWEISRWVSVLTTVNPETYCRDWRSVQELNPHLQGKDWIKRQRHATRVSEEKIDQKHDPDIFKRMEFVATKAEQWDLFCN